MGTSKCMRIDGSRADPGHPSPDPISFIFMHFSANILPNNRLAIAPLRLAPHSSVWEILEPPLMREQIFIDFLLQDRLFQEQQQINTTEYPLNFQE